MPYTATTAAVQRLEAVMTFMSRATHLATGTLISGVGHTKVRTVIDTSGPGGLPFARMKWRSTLRQLLKIRQQGKPMPIFRL